MEKSYKSIAFAIGISTGIGTGIGICVPSAYASYELRTEVPCDEEQIKKIDLAKEVITRNRQEIMEEINLIARMHYGGIPIDDETMTKNSLTENQFEEFLRTLDSENIVCSNNTIIPALGMAFPSSHPLVILYQDAWNTEVNGDCVLVHALAHETAHIWKNEAHSLRTMFGFGLPDQITLIGERAKSACEEEKYRNKKN